MPQQDAVSKVRYALGPDTPDIALHTKNIVDDTRSLLRPIFTTTSARDTAYAAAYGGSIPEGVYCYILDSGEWEYDGAQWVPSGPRIASSRTWTGTTVTSANSTQVSVTSVHNQLCRMYRNRLCQITLAQVNLSGTAGDLWQIDAGIDTTTYMTLKNVHDVSGGPGQVFTAGPSAPFILAPDSASVPHRLQCYLSRPAGTGTTTLLNINFVVTDLGPA